MKNKIRQFIIVVIVLLASLCLVFIFGNSLKDSSESGEQSKAVKDLLVSIAAFFGIEGDIDIAMLRNLAHVAEFAFLGLCLGLLSFYTARRKNPVSRIRYVTFFFATVGVGILIAIIDELIQLTSKGRACEIKDVLLDAAGIIIGNVFSIVFYLLIVKLKSRREKLHKEKLQKTLDKPI